MRYIKTTIELTPYDEVASQILMAQMGEMGFDSFCDTENGFEGYAQEGMADEESLATLSPMVEGVEMKMTSEMVDDEDWNKEWEENYFKPIVIGDKCLVRSPFHESQPGFKYEIIINPQMSFGTGYHETTTQMMEYIMQADLTSKNVLDMGCGTGILGILAEKCGAAKVECVDIDEWCFKNATESIELNGCKNIHITLGGAETLPQEPVFDVILANINRNILVRDMQIYAAALKHGGTIMMSGFYEQDIPVITDEACRHGLKLEETHTMNEWSAIKLLKL